MNLNKKDTEIVDRWLEQVGAAALIRSNDLVLDAVDVEGEEVASARFSVLSGCGSVPRGIDTSAGAGIGCFFGYVEFNKDYNAQWQADADFTWNDFTQNCGGVGLDICDSHQTLRAAVAAAKRHERRLAAQLRAAARVARARGEESFSWPTDGRVGGYFDFNTRKKAAA
jgi:hypothetical protein